MRVNLHVILREDRGGKPTILNWKQVQGKQEIRE